jgi:carbamoyl-phosphate synthase small subunit
MTDNAYLVLEDGSVYVGTTAGASRWGYGEVVFNTSMTGYQEILTDPSYAGQIVLMTYPLLGNYGTIETDIESSHVQAAGLVMREECMDPSHRKSRSSLREYLEHAGVPAIAGVDTRAITRKLRSGGVLMGAISSAEPPEQILSRLRELPRYANVDFVRRVSTPQPYTWPTEREARARIAIIDTGLKYNIARVLASKGCRTVVLPSSAGLEEILAQQPDGVVLSPGPGDPVHLDALVDTARALVHRLPVMGICLGHQVLGRAFGAETYKLKFGHHGANHPVKDLVTGAVHITSQNHGYAIDPDGLRGGAEPSHVNLNDGTCEGLRHPDLPIVSIQYHSEASPGPHDNMYLFDQFLEFVDGQRKKA